MASESEMETASDGTGDGGIEDWRSSGEQGNGDWTNGDRSNDDGDGGDIGDGICCIGDIIGSNDDDNDDSTREVVDEGFGERNWLDGVIVDIGF